MRRSACRHGDLDAVDDDVRDADGVAGETLAPTGQVGDLTDRQRHDGRRVERDEIRVHALSDATTVAQPEHTAGSSVSIRTASSIVSAPKPRTPSASSSVG